MEEIIKTINEMVNILFGVGLILLLLVSCVFGCVLYITEYVQKRDKDFLVKKRSEIIKRKDDIDYRLLAHSQQLKYLIDEIDKIKKRRK